MDLRITLRLLGPLLQLLSLVGLFVFPQLMNQNILGTTWKYAYLAYGLFLVGFVMVMAAVALGAVRRPEPPRRP